MYSVSAGIGCRGIHIYAPTPARLPSLSIYTAHSPGPQQIQRSK